MRGTYGIPFHWREILGEAPSSAICFRLALHRRNTLSPAGCQCLTPLPPHPSHCNPLRSAQKLLRISNTPVYFQTPLRHTHHARNRMWPLPACFHFHASPEMPRVAGRQQQFMKSSANHDSRAQQVHLQTGQCVRHLHLRPHAIFGLTLSRATKSALPFGTITRPPPPSRPRNEC